MGGHPEVIPGKTCVNCGKPIPWRRSQVARDRAKYCSEACRLTRSEFIPGKQCLQCDGPIKWIGGLKDRKARQFCGTACASEYQKQHPTRPRYERLTAPCANCSKPTEYLPSQIGPTRPNRPSKKLTEEILAECRRRNDAGETQSALAREFGVSLASMSIGIRFGPLGDPRGTPIYCSTKCSEQAQAKAVSTWRPSNGMYGSDVSFRNAVRTCFLDQCSLCGWDEASCDVAHIIPRSAGGAHTLDNVTMLCPNCHRVFDCGLIPVEEVQAARYSVLIPDNERMTQRAWKAARKGRNGTGPVPADLEWGTLENLEGD